MLFGKRIGETNMITKDMTIGEIVRLYPQTLEVFSRFGLDCFECQVAEFEQLEHGAGVHKVDVDKLLEELNRMIGE
jgi:hybrid cluster-associated redox disulfide protein